MNSKFGAYGSPTPGTFSPEEQASILGSVTAALKIKSTQDLLAGLVEIPQPAPFILVLIQAELVSRGVALPAIESAPVAPPPVAPTQPTRSSAAADRQVGAYATAPPRGRVDYMADKAAGIASATDAELLAAKAAGVAGPRGVAIMKLIDDEIKARGLGGYSKYLYPGIAAIVVLYLVSR